MICYKSFQLAQDLQQYVENENFDSHSWIIDPISVISPNLDLRKSDYNYAFLEWLSYQSFIIDIFKMVKFQ